MAKARGPAPTPSAILRLRGSNLANKRTGEPVFPAARLDPPEFLNRIAKEEWARVAPLLYSAGVLTKADRAALCLYCQAWSDWVQAVEMIEAGGFLSTTPNGYSIASVWTQLKAAAQKSMLAAMAELGLSPSSRTRIRADAAPADDQDDDFSGLLKAGSK